MLSGDEQDRWRRIEAELAGEPRLVGLNRKLLAMHGGSPLLMKVCLIWLVGGIAGAVALTAGSLAHVQNLLVAGVGLLVATLLVAGVLLIAVGLRTD